VVRLRSGFAVQHYVPAPGEEVYLLRHARCRAWYGWQHLMQAERGRCQDMAKNCATNTSAPLRRYSSPRVSQRPRTGYE
jgi:hypothetical protein